MKTKAAEAMKARLARYGYRLRQLKGGSFDVIDLRKADHIEVFATGLHAVREWFAEVCPKRARISIQRWRVAA